MFQNLSVRIKDRLCRKENRTSWALNRLDLKMEPYLRQRGGFFVEAGCNDGLTQSNTLYFEKYLGWRGLLIEAIPTLAEQCRQNRPRCLVENCALVSRDYTGETIEMHYRNLMSIVKGSMMNADDEQKFLDLGAGCMRPDDKLYTLAVPAKTLGRVLDKHRLSRIDLLSLDVEGYELEVLQGIDFARHQPVNLLLEVRDLPAVKKVISTWYRQIAILNQNDIYADILFQRTR